MITNEDVLGIPLCATHHTAADEEMRRRSRIPS